MTRKTILCVHNKYLTTVLILSGEPLNFTEHVVNAVTTAHAASRVSDQKKN